MEKNVMEMSMLYDFYGELLTERQKSIMQYYYGDDYSLAEIASETGTSRQAVYDTVRKAEKALRSYEDKLGLVRRFVRTGAELRRASGVLDEVMEACGGADAEKLRSVQRIIDRLEEEL